MELINELSNRIVMDGYDTKIVAASFKGVQQIKRSLQLWSAGDYSTSRDLETDFQEIPSIEKAVDDFNADWYSMYGEGKGICDL